MNNAFILLNGISIGLMLLLSAQLLTQYRKLCSAWFLMLMMFGAASYTLRPFVTPEPGIQFLMQTLSSAVPAVFWLFTVSFFGRSDNQHLGGLQRYHYLGLAISLLLTVAICSRHYNEAQSVPMWLSISDYSVKSLMVILGLRMVMLHWRDDLVESRRWLRAVFLGTTGVLLLADLTGGLIYGFESLPQPFTYFNAIMVFLITLGISYWMMIVHPGAFLEAIDSLPDGVDRPQQPVSGNLSSQDETWLSTLHVSMQDQQAYRQNDLTIRSLSQQTTIPEHHLRRLINQQLGYRNFNDYLNRFRVNDAATRLRNPKHANLPITTIALESGYASLTTFNKAFKAITDMTPSEFRRIGLQTGASH